MHWRATKKPPQDLTKWHYWFAWKPVRIGDYRWWLCRVYRRGTHHDDSLGGYWVWEYDEPRLLYY